MRKVIFTLCFVLSFTIALHAQPYLFSVTHGTSDDLSVENPHGTISKFDIATNTLIAVYSFTGAEGSHPSGKLLQASDGMFYGVTSEGGAYNAGVLFSFHPLINAYTKLHDFNVQKGAHPVSHLVQASDGKLYGVTMKGGLNGMGIIYSFDIIPKTFTKLFDFDGPNGAFPNSGLLQATDGKLYGMTPEGGALLYGSFEFTAGVLFSFDPSSNTFIKLREFGVQQVSNPPYQDNWDGAKPYGSLIQAKDGKLYGTTAFGGETTGTIFSFDPATKAYFNKTFPASGMFHPFSTLLQAADGLLYGLTKNGGTSRESGVAFSYNIGENSLNLMGISSMATQPRSPIRPATSFINSSNGLLYSVTREEGPGMGFVFSHQTGTQDFVRQALFNGTNGLNPVETLTEYMPCSTTFKSSIPNVTVLPNGVEENTVYLGYAPAAVIKLAAEANNGGGNYTYQWSNGATTPGIIVSPSKNTTYSVVITDSRGCTSTVSKEIKAVDVRCGNEKDKVLICKVPPGNPKNTKEECLQPADVAAQLAKGSYLGGCKSPPPNTPEPIEISKDGLTINLLPNPSTTYFTLNVSSDKNEKVSILLFDIIGRMVEKKIVSSTSATQFGGSLRPGNYYAVITQGPRVIVMKLVKQ